MGLASGYREPEKKSLLKPYTNFDKMRKKMEYKLPKDYKKPGEKDLYNAFKIPKFKTVNELAQKTAEKLTRIGRKREEYIANQYYDKGYQNAKAKYDRGHGHWIVSWDYLKCSNCDCGFTDHNDTKIFSYCPNCGAQMDQEVEDNAID